MRRTRVVVLSVLASVLLLLLAACSAPNGSLKVRVNGLPGGVDGKVLVTGPAGYSKTVTSTATLSVAPGTYSVTPRAASNGDAIVATLYDGSASSSSVAVTSDTTSSTTVTYALRVGSAHAWLPMWHVSFEVESIARGNLASSGPASPDVTLTSAQNDAEAVAFDGSGNMWVVDQAGDVNEYDASQLGTTHTPVPVATIDASAYTRLYGAAFDGSGDLWISAHDSDQLIMYTPTQLAAGGTLTPKVIIDATPGGSLNGPSGLAFDSSGALWAANTFGNSIVKYKHTQLTSGGSLTPAVKLTITSGSINTPFGLAFDASGNLWVANHAGTVVRFGAGKLGSTGSPPPDATIGGGAAGATPSGVAFDASGDLWILNSDNSASTGDLRRFANPDSLTGSVTSAPDTTISSVGAVDGGGFAFDPPPANLPIRTP